MPRPYPSRLRAWRLLRGLSYDDAGALVGISPAYFRIVERGIVPSNSVAQRFLEAFDEPLEELLKDVSLRNLPTLQREAR